MAAATKPLLPAFRILQLYRGLCSGPDSYASLKTGSGDFSDIPTSLEPTVPSENEPDPFFSGQLNAAPSPIL
jgi:hypothetical protein